MISKKDERNLRLGNLVLAILLSTVPTTITYGTLGIHGTNVCKALNAKITTSEKEKINELCNSSAWETTSNYILLIGFFITLPTWFFFYLSVKNKQKRKDYH